ncbi:MAG: HD family phosphohydrolase, partial [Nitrospirae bacterium]|nr:HD family phosphohydrolase [Nitrospirota bacterium]
RILSQIPEKYAELILTAVRFHNALNLPKKIDKDALLLLKMLRDADKLDIWRVFLELLALPLSLRPSAPGFKLPIVDEYNSNAVKNIFNKKVVLISQLKCENDIKLMQLSWIFDLNFKETIKLMIERDYINKLLANIPNTEEIKKLNIFLHELANLRLRNWVDV